MKKLLTLLLLFALPALAQQSSFPSPDYGPTFRDDSKFGPVFSPTTPPDPPPNIVYIIIDDMGVEEVYDHVADVTPYDSVATPSATMAEFDKLVANGVKYTQAWAAPSCAPYRATAHTGRTQNRTGVSGPTGDNWDSRGEFTVWNAAKAVGYDTYFVGKLGLGSMAIDPAAITTDMGIDYFYGFPQSGQSNYQPWNITEVSNGTVLQEAVSTNSYLANDLTLKAVDILNNLGTAPFFLTVSRTLIHSPLHRPATPTNESCASAWADCGEDMYERFDADLKTIMDLLDTLSLLPNTLVVLMADNGSDTGVSTNIGTLTQGTPSKGTSFEAGLRVPLIFAHGPVDLSLRNTTTAQPFDAASVFTTLVNFMGASHTIPSNVPELADNSYYNGQRLYIDGISHAQYLSGAGSGPPAAFQRYHREAATPADYLQSDGRFKLYVQDDYVPGVTAASSVFFYDLSTDILETTTLCPDLPATLCTATDIANFDPTQRAAFDALYEDLDRYLATLL